MKVWTLGIFIGLLASRLLADEAATWAFDPGQDTFSQTAILDLSGLNEDTAGEAGFVRRSRDGANFVRGDGSPVRFWAVNTSVAQMGMPALRHHARFLAKRGVNMVRFHGQIPQGGKTGGPLHAIDATERMRLWMLVAAMKDEGIYVTFSPYYPHAVREEAARRWSSPRDSAGLAGLIYFDPDVQDAYKNWLRQTLTPVNPHTGLALKDDPALAIIQMQNEDSLLFWTLNEIEGREADLLGARFGSFLKAKYGSLEQAKMHWNNAGAPGPLDGMDDDWARGVIALSNIWHLTDAAGKSSAEIRLRDQAEFLTLTMRDWHAEMARFLREDIGAPQLFNPGNWRTADDIFLDDLERYAHTTGDVVGVNRYVGNRHDGERPGWAIVNGDRFRENGLLNRPLDLPVAVRQPVGHPYIVPETLWVPPVWQQSEGPVLMAAYQSLTGVDISYWFETNTVQWRQPQSANGYLPSIGKWVVATPQIIGAFPAAALMFRNRAIDTPDPVLTERRALDDLWSRTRPLAAPGQGRDPNRDTPLTALWSGARDMPETSTISPYVFLTGPVLVEFDSSAADVVHPKLDRLINPEQRSVTSANGQLHWNWGAGVVTLDAPRAQGVIGALAAQHEFRLQDVTIASPEDYASVIVVPLDKAPIARSERLLIQIGSIARPTGWRADPVQLEDGPALEVVDFGTAPWQINRVSANITLNNSAVSRATVLDPNGMPDRELTVLHGDGQLSFELPDDALYVVVD
ncbi:MAG: hypothetical protein AAF484_01040 [Pseudomonadota bacterium]